MKKIIALLLSLVMMFSMTSVSYATDSAVSTQSSVMTIDNYMDYLETKLEGENFFIRLIARLVIIGVMLGFIKVEDFEDWFENTSPKTDNDSMSSDWEDGAEVMLHQAQSLPYTEYGVTITNIKITKEHYDGISEYAGIVTCKYDIEIYGSCPDYDNEKNLYISLILENAHYGFGLSNYEHDFEIYDDGTFILTGTHCSSYDSNRFVIDGIVYEKDF